MKFCPECGSQLPVGPAKFCPNCGKSLWNVTESSGTFEEQKEATVQSGQTAIYSLGVKLEQMVEQIMKNKGFSTERRIKLRGRSGTFNEIDVLAKRQNDVLAVECKNYGEARLVGIKEIRDFQSKLEDLSQINHAMFVTNIKFTSEAAEYAQHKHIEIWDGEKLSRDFYLLNLGRLGPNETASPTVTVLDCALPIKTQYNEVAKLLLLNPHVTIIETTLNLHPYYLFEYQADVKKGLLRRSEIECGRCIVDATNKKIIQAIEDDAKYTKYAQSFFSKENDQNQDEGLEEILDQMEKTQIIEDIENMQPTSRYKIENSSEYAINKLEPKLRADAAERMVLEDVVRKTNAEEKNVIIKKPSLIYVPKWLINIQSNETQYRREVLPASETVIIDEIRFCPKEFYEKRRSSNKKTYAVCEVCGCAYCSKHISLINDSYYCEKHRYRSNTKKIAARDQQIKNIELSLSNIENSLDNSIDKALEKTLYYAKVSPD